MFTAMFGSVEQGIIYAIMALGVYLTFRVLDFPDLTGYSQARSSLLCNGGRYGRNDDCTWL